MGKLIKIKVNDPQPLPCVNCKEFGGYQYDDKMSTFYSSIHNAEGKYEGGQYTDRSTNLKQGKIPYCANCGTRLPFRLIREKTEDVS